MKSAAPGQSTSQVEVTNVSRHGFWILIGEQELFAPFKKFPWFKDASIGEITRVELPSPHHLYWPDLDVDLAEPAAPGRRLRLIGIRGGIGIGAQVGGHRMAVA